MFNVFVLGGGFLFRVYLLFFWDGVLVVFLLIVSIDVLNLWCDNVNNVGKMNIRGKWIVYME